jgi:hypothetical protein
MTTKKFEVKIVDQDDEDRGTPAILEADQQVFDVVDDEWRRSLYPLHTNEEIAEHVAYNLIVNHIGLSRMDGWADQPDSNLKFVSGMGSYQEASDDETRAVFVRWV